jgi:predicted aspartyl protease
LFRRSIPPTRSSDRASDRGIGPPRAGGRRTPWEHARNAALLSLLAAPAHAACSTHRVAELPLTLTSEKLLVNVSLNGSPEIMALDTGAGITVVSTEAAGRLNIPHDFDHHADIGGVGGADSALFIGLVDTLDLDGLRLTHQALPIVDLPMRDGAGHPVAGFLGADILSRFDVDLDIAGGRLGLWQETGCDTAPPPWDPNADALPIDLDEGHHILVPLRVDGVNLTAVLDTGAGGLDLTLRAGMRAGATDDALDADPVIHGTGVNNRGWTGHMHRFHSVIFGGRTISEVWTALVPSSDISRNNALIGSDGLVGMRVLRDMHLWISYRTKSLYVAPGNSRD